MLDFPCDVGYGQSEGELKSIHAFIDFKAILLYKLNVGIDLSLCGRAKIKIGIVRWKVLNVCNN